MSPDEIPIWVLIASSLAALFTAVATLMTVLELRRQRQAGYKPDIVLQSASFGLYWNQTKSGFPLWFTSNPYFEPSLMDLDHIRGDDRIAFNALNVGKGTAKQVSLQWDYEFLDIAEIIARVDEEGLYTLLRNDWGVEISSDRFGSRMMSASSSSIDLNHMVSSAVSETVTPLFVPSDYLHLFAIFVMFLTEHLANDGTEITVPPMPEFPKLSAVVSYSDLEGHLLKQRFKIKPVFHTLTSGPKELRTGMAMSGLLQISEIGLDS